MSFAILALPLALPPFLPISDRYFDIAVFRAILFMLKPFEEKCKSAIDILKRNQHRRFWVMVMQLQHKLDKENTCQPQLNATP